MASDLIVVGTYLNTLDADLAMTALEAAGIDCMVRADDCGGLRPHLWMGGVEVLVRTADLQRALEVLDSAAVVADTPQHG